MGVAEAGVDIVAVSAWASAGGLGLTIVRFALGRVTQGGVCFRDFLESFFGIVRGVDVRVELFGKFVELRFDLCLRRTAGHLERRIVVQSRDSRMRW